MGVSESHEDVQETLQTLTNLSDAEFDSTIKGLGTILKQRYDLQISKWDLMQLMSFLTTIQIKRITQTITGKKDPNTVSIHLLIIALIMSRRSLAVQDKVKMIFNIICYEVNPGRLQKSEVQYIFHLMYHWIKITTKLELSTSRVQQCTEDRMFDKHKETVSKDETVVWISQQEELSDIFNIFTKVTRSQIADFKASDEYKTLKAIYYDQQKKAEAASVEQANELPQKGRRATLNAVNASQEKIAAVTGGAQAQAAVQNEASLQSSKVSLVAESKPVSQETSLAKPITTQPVLNQDQQQNAEDQQPGDAMSTQRSGTLSPKQQGLVLDYQPNLRQPQKQLLWNAKILTQLGEICGQTAQPSEQHDHSQASVSMHADTTQLSRMNEKLIFLREQKVLDQDRISNLIDLNNKFNLLETTNMEFYGQRQLTYMMRSLFYEKQLTSTGYSIMKFVKGTKDSDVTEMQDSQSTIQTEESVFFDSVMTRAQTAKSFKEFYRQNLSEVKYEMLMHQTRLQQYLSTRGSRRILERKKYKCLGEISTLTKIIDQMGMRKRIIAKMIATKKPKETTKQDNSAFLGFVIESPSHGKDKAGSPRGDRSARETEEEVLNNMLPQDWFYQNIYKELDQLRASGLSRKDFIELIQQKNLKKHAIRTVYFLEGALDSLKGVNAVKTFAEVPEFREFHFKINQRHNEEYRIMDKCLQIRQQSKENYNEYSSQLGKLKGFQFAVSCQEKGDDDVDFLNHCKARLALLFSRLEGIDMRLVAAIQEQIGKKKCNKLFFLATGRLSVYKCMSKGLSVKYLTNYLNVTLSKLRIQEVFECAANTKAFESNQVHKNYDQDTNTSTGTTASGEIFTRLNSDFFKFLHTIELDKYFNLEASSTDSQCNFEKFQEDLQQIAEDERLQAEMNLIERDNNDLKFNNDPLRIENKLAPTVNELMRASLLNHKMDKTFLGEFKDFVEKKLPSKNIFPVDRDNKQAEQLTQMDQLLMKANTCFFDFVDIEDIFTKDNQMGRDMITQMRGLSASLNQAEFSEVFIETMNSMNTAHSTCREFANHMLQGVSEHSYLEQFKKTRSKVFTDFMKSLRLANKGHLINNFNMYLMSLPLENSPRNNFWFAYALQAQIDAQEKEEKFLHLVQAGSTEIGRRREKFLASGSDFQPQLAMNCFWMGPCSVFANSEVSPSNEEDTQECRKQFEHHYKFTKGAQHREQRFRQAFFIDQANYFDTRTRYRELLVDILEDLIKNKSEMRNLKHLQSSLYDKAYSRQARGQDLQNLIQKHLELKMKVTDEARSNAIIGIIQGSDDFISEIIAKRENASIPDPDSQEVLRLLQIQIKAIMKTVCYKPDARRRISKNSANGPTSTVSMAFHSSLDLGSKKNVSKAAIPQMLATTENDLVDLITGTHFFYKLIGQASQSLNLFQFYADIEENLVQVKQEILRRNQIKSFLKRASQVQDPAQDFMQVHVKELGSRICQDLIAGLNISPEFCYDPYEEVDHQHVSSAITSMQGSLSPTSSKKNVSKLGGLSRKTSTSNAQKVVGLKRGVTKNKSAVQSKKRNITIEIGDEEEKLANEDLNTVQEITKMYKKTRLSASQTATNMTLNYLNEICLIDDKITARQILKNNKFFDYLQMSRVVLDQGMAQFYLRENMTLGLERLLNVFEVANTPLERYLINFERISRFIQQELVPTITSTDESHLKFFFFDTMSKKGSALVKQTINKVENYLGLAALDDADKLSFSSAQTKIKRELDQHLRWFKEFIDLEDNKKVAQRHQSMIKHQELRLMQEIGSMMLLVRTYYLKQNIFKRTTNSQSHRGEQHF